MKGFTMVKNDRKIATFYSCFKNGDIEVWYCSCSFCNVYELRYVVSFDTPEGLKDAVGLRSYNTNDYAQMLNDAIALANTALLERD
jgi:hypothetical protein|uniref:Uncharacterized protein n=1 Tax=virus sp. ctSf81 TaxID=2826803 RepID=A0A8S5NDX7_9VIRU|nr:MAG TPA: hypothetical protein [virus sp. ctSf81]